MSDNNDDIEPEDEAEALCKKVDARIEATNPDRESKNLSTTYVDWVADQVDGSLEQVIDAVLNALLTPEEWQFIAVLLATDVKRDSDKSLPDLADKHLQIWEKIQSACQWNQMF